MVNDSEFAVEHIGTVVSTDEREHIAMVNVSRGEDCAGCKIASVCRGDSVVTLRAAVVRGIRADSALISEADALHDRRGLSEGDRVRITTSRYAGMRAVMLLFLLPLTAMVATIAVLSWCSDLTEGVIALASVSAVSVTYLILWALRRYVDKQIEWRVVEVIARATDS